MDGIFGVGVAEIIVVILVLFTVGGPENTAKWAREAGRWVRKAREAWSQVMAEMENELGPEGKEVMDAARELSKGVKEARNLSPTRRMVNETVRMVESSVDVSEDKTESVSLPNPQTTQTEAEPQNGSTTPTETKYTAWVSPDKAN